MKKRILSTLLIAAMALSMSGCSKHEAQLQASDELSYSTENNGADMSDRFKSSKWNIIKDAMNENKLCKGLNDEELFKEFKESVKINTVLTGRSFNYNIDDDEQFWSYYLSDAALNILNSKADAVLDCVDIFLVSADTLGYGMKRDSAEILNITVTDGVWNCTAVDSSYFKSNGEISWGTNGSAKNGDVNIDMTKAENRLCQTLANDFPEIENAAFRIGVDSGYCRSVAYIPYRSEPLALGKDCPDINVYDGCSFALFHWNGETGLNDNNEYVGTSPQVW